ncbi:MAG TPA: hypothetical protein VJA21_16425 [Verrucomicrobiae bacterium]
MNLRITNVLKFLVCVLLVFAAAHLQAQLLKNIRFSAAEGYVTGPLYGQPAGAGGETWANVSPIHNNGMTLFTNDAIWYQEIVTNGMMAVVSDGQLGTNNSGVSPRTADSVCYWAMPFPVQKKGPITVTWDWKFVPTNAIPADYDPTNNPYATGWPALPDGTFLQETDCGFTLADSANRNFSGGADSDVVFNELSTITRFGGDHYADSRWNWPGACDGGGNWQKMGPRYQDGKWIHEKMVAYVGLEGASVTSNNCFNVWAQREGEDIWQTAYAEAFDTWPAFGMRRCPGDTDPNGGIDCITMWMNDSGPKFGTMVLVDNIVVLGPVPVLSVERTGPNVIVTYSGTLQSATDPKGPFSDLATGPFMKPLATLEVAPSGAGKFYRSVYY